MQEQGKKLGKEIRALEEMNCMLGRGVVKKEEYEELVRDYRAIEEKLAEVMAEVKKYKAESQKLQEELASANRNLYVMREARENNRQSYLNDLAEDSDLLESFVCQT